MIESSELILKILSLGSLFFNFSENFSLEKVNSASKNILDSAKIEYEKTVNYGGKYVSFFDKEYPNLLKEIPNPPILLTILGNLSLLNKNSIAIVGSRNASYDGINLASSFANEFTQKNICIISGLAKGIDSSVHKGAINENTIAVIGSGISHRYPKENSKLYDEMIEKKCSIITEYSFETAPMPGNFPKRNRIIAGMSLGTLIIEAGMQSGSLVTARLAREFNRDVFAIPGFAFDSRYKGNNYLIKNNIAKLVESTEDILSELNLNEIDFSKFKRENTKKNDHLFVNLDKKDQIEPENTKTALQDEEINQDNSDSGKILNILSAKQLSIDEIASRSGLSISSVQSCLIELEMLDKIRSNGIGMYSRVFVGNKK